MTGHKLVVDSNGKLLYISKECSSNGCAATLDITYPSAPLFLIYNTELLKAMLKPIKNNFYLTVFHLIHVRNTQNPTGCYGQRLYVTKWKISIYSQTACGMLITQCAHMFQ